MELPVDFTKNVHVMHVLSRKSAIHERALRAHLPHTAAMDTKWFKSRMKAVGVTQDYLGERLARDRSLVSKLLAGRVRIDIQQVPVLAEVLQVSIYEVLRRLGLPLGDPPPHGAQPHPVDARSPEYGTEPHAREPDAHDRAALRFAFEKVMLNFIDEADGTLEPEDIDGIFDRVWRGYSTIGVKGDQAVK